MKPLKLNSKCNHDKLINFGFKKYGMNYKMFIPLYTSKNETFIEAEFLVSTLDNYIGYDVIDKNIDMIYSPFYNPEYSGGNNNLVLQKVKEKLASILADMSKSQIIILRGENG